MAYPSFRSSLPTNSYSGSTVTVDTPAGAASGDVLICTFIDGQGNRTLDTLPEGWSIIASDAVESSPGSGFWVCKKKLTAAPAASYDFGFSATFYGRAEMSAWQTGSDVSVTSVATYGAVQTASPYDIAAAAVTVPDAETLLVFIGATRVTTDGVLPAHTAPSGFTERVDSGLSYDVRAITLADKQVGSGSSGTATGTVAWASAGDTYTVGVLLAIAPTGGSSQISLTGEANCPTVASVSASAASASVTAGNYYDVVVTVRDQEGAVLPWLTGSAASTDTGVATVALLAATDSSGQATLRITGVAVGTTTVTATFDGIVSNSVPVTVITGSTSPVVIIPTTLTIPVNNLYQFEAAISGETSPSFTWSVLSGGGSIDSNGLFTAPATEQTVVVKVANTADSNMYATATITVQGTTMAATTHWVYEGVDFANTALDYVIKAADNTIITSGTGTTDTNGNLVVEIDTAYAGQSVLVHVENVTTTMNTSGKVHGCQPATVI